MSWPPFRIILYYFILFYAISQYKLAFYNIIKTKGVAGMKELKEKISITIDSDIIKKTKELAEQDDRSLSQYINKVLKQHLETIDKNK